MGKKTIVGWKGIAAFLIVLLVVYIVVVILR